MRFRKIFLIFLTSFAFLLSLDSRFSQQKENKKYPSPHYIHPLPSLNNGRPFNLDAESYSQERVLVKFSPRLNPSYIASILASYSAKKIRKLSPLDIYVIKIPDHSSVEEMLWLLKKNPDVEYVEPDYSVTIATIPNDPLFSFQYALYNSGDLNGLPGNPPVKLRADIKAPEAWEETTGNEGVIIAVIDTGIDFLHPDLKSKIQQGGRDFVNDDFDPTDDHGHGTFVAGIIAADTNNGEGIAGVCWKCKLLPIKAIGEEGYGYYSWLIQSILWAAEKGAQVINLSVSAYGNSEGLREALQFAHEKDIVIAAAAGNHGIKQVSYPATFNEYCLAVAATDFTDSRTNWSNYGPEIDVAAPGAKLLSSVPTWKEPSEYLPYAFGWGTSYATAHVSGLAALIKSIKPWLKASEVMSIIRYSSDDINSDKYPGKDEYIGYGRINMEKALVPRKIINSP